MSDTYHGSTSDNTNDLILQHYGVIGMKWGVSKARRYASKHDKLLRKAYKYDAKSAALTKKSEKAHSKYDLGEANKAAVKSAKYAKKAAKLNKKAVDAGSDLEASRLRKKAEKYNYKSAQKQIEANRISKTTGYGKKAMKYSVKSDKVAAKAAKARKKLASNEAYIQKMKTKISKIPKEDLDKGYAFCKELLND